MTPPIMTSSSTDLWSRKQVSATWRAFLATVCLLLAQTALAVHVDDHVSHTTGVDCQLCQGFERSALPGPTLATVFRSLLVVTNPISRGRCAPVSYTHLTLPTKA